MASRIINATYRVRCPVHTHRTHTGVDPEDCQSVLGQRASRVPDPCQRRLCLIHTYPRNRPPRLSGTSKAPSIHCSFTNPRAAIARHIATTERAPSASTRTCYCNPPAPRCRNLHRSARRTFVNHVCLAGFDRDYDSFMFAGRKSKGLAWCNARHNSWVGPQNPIISSKHDHALEPGSFEQILPGIRASWNRASPCQHLPMFSGRERTSRRISRDFTSASMPKFMQFPGHGHH